MAVLFPFGLHRIHHAPLQCFQNLGFENVQAPKLTTLEMNMMIRVGRGLCLQDVAGAVSALEADAQIARIMKASRSA